VSNSSSLPDIYTKLTEIIDSYDKCNSIYSLANSKMPFPIVEVTMYAIVLVVCIVVITMVIMKYKPGESISAVLLAKRANDLVDDLVDDDLGKNSTKKRPDGNQPPEKTNEATDNQMLAIKISSIILILVICGLFVATLSQNTTSYASKLYSNYGQNDMCAK
jgi:hypothetical protein